MGSVTLFFKNLLFPPVDEQSFSVEPDVADEIGELGHKISAARSRFDFAESDDEIETAISDLNALERRYRLLMQIKRTESKS